MEVVGHWEPDFRGYRRVHFAVPGRRRRWWLLRVAGALVALVDLLVLVFAGQHTTAWIDLSAGLLLMFGGDLLLVVRWRQLRAAGGPMRFEISDAGVGVGNGSTDVLTRPAAFVVSYTLRDAWLFYPPAGAPLAVPRRAFPADDAARIDAMLADRGFGGSEQATQAPGAPTDPRHVVGRLTLDFGEYRRIYQATSGGRGWTVRGVLFVATVLLVLLVWPPHFGGAYLATAGGGVAVALYDVRLLRGWNRMKARAAEPWTYDVSETGVLIRTPLADTTFRWDAVTDVRRQPDAWQFKLRDGKSIPIPKAAFPTGAATHVDLLVDYWGLAAEPPY